MQLLLNPDRFQSHGSAARADGPLSSALPLRPDMLPSVEGFRDRFLERRYTPACGIDVAAHAQQGTLVFLSKLTHVDEYYRLEAAIPRYGPGLYRIRDEGGSSPFVTLKQQGDLAGQFATTVDIVSPSERDLLYIRRHGKLVAVIEKEREVYRSKQAPDCLLNVDHVRSLGTFIDIKADHPETMERFLMQLMPDPDAVVSQSYLELKQARGISAAQLKVWRFHEQFKDYIMGVVSGTLTPLGFMCATLASTQSKSALVIALLSAGLSDGISDAVANSQVTQSDSKVSALSQTGAFFKTLAGKCVVPATFIPIALAFESNVAVGAVAAALAAVYLSATAAVQALAKERAVLPAVAKLLAWGVAATAVGSAVGYAIPEAFRMLKAA